MAVCLIDDHRAVGWVIIELGGVQQGYSVVGYEEDKYANLECAIAHFTKRKLFGSLKCIRTVSNHLLPIALS